MPVPTWYSLCHRLGFSSVGPCPFHFKTLRSRCLCVPLCHSPRFRPIANRIRPPVNPKNPSSCSWNSERTGGRRRIGYQVAPATATDSMAKPLTATTNAKAASMDKPARKPSNSAAESTRPFSPHCTTRHGPQHHGPAPSTSNRPEARLARERSGRSTAIPDSTVLCIRWFRPVFVFPSGPSVATLRAIENLNESCRVRWPLVRRNAPPAVWEIGRACQPIGPLRT